ncbi:MAG: hypothetical protein ACI845_001066 [Gammaproteobacteria bacterium]|jgi:hypothetical protein
MWVCEIDWKDSDDIKHDWAGNGCSGGVGAGPVTSGGGSDGGSSSGGSSGGGSSGGNPDPVGGILTRSSVSLINVTGEVGGPFASGTGFLDVSNTGDQSLYFDLNYDNPYLDVFPSSGALSPGQTKRVSVNLTSEVNKI